MKHTPNLYTVIAVQFFAIAAGASYLALAPATDQTAPASAHVSVAPVSNRGAEAPVSNLSPDELAALLTGIARADVNGDGLADGRDIQAYVDLTIVPPPDPWAAIKAHPYLPEVRARLDSFLRWPGEKWSDSPHALMRTLDYCAQLHALTGEWPSPEITLPIIRRIADEWPLALPNFNHDLTAHQIPTMHRAARLSPIAMDALREPLRWCAERMTGPSATIFSTGIGPGLRDVVMIHELLDGEEKARDVALNGFGPFIEQWGLPQIVDKVIDDSGLLNVNVGAPGRWAWNNRPALVWLLEIKGYKEHLSDSQRARWRKFYELPCRLLCAGGQSFTLPGANDDYSMNPILGPAAAWVGDTEMDQWARWHARAYERRSGGLRFESLSIPADEGYAPAERPAGCSGRRVFTRIILDETADGAETTVTYLGDGVSLHGGHKLGRPVTIIVNRPATSVLSTSEETP